MDSDVIRQRYHADTAGEEGAEEEWKELRLSWKELPNVYLKLSKSRLTSVSLCVRIAHVMILGPSPSPQHWWS